MAFMTGKEAGLVLCTECHSIHHYSPGVDLQCSGCGAELHQRKPHSLNRN